MNIVKSFCEKYDIPREAVKTLCEALERLKSHPARWDIFQKCIKLYEEDYSFDHTPVFEEIEALSKPAGIHPYTLIALYLISLTPHLKILYNERGLAEDIFDDSVCDIKWKLQECKTVYGIWGTFVGWWTIDFFKLKRFALGRLQFNLKPLSVSFEGKGLSLTPDDIIIDVHIPSCGPLNHDECLKSYRRAEILFKDDLPAIFHCNSWLLAPENRLILPPDSNILRFMDDYTIIESGDDPENSNLWRIFGVMKLPDDLRDLPADSSLRRAFIDWLKKGNSICHGRGIFLFENGEILNDKTL